MARTSLLRRSIAGVGVPVTVVSALVAPVAPAQAMVSTPTQNADIAVKDETLHAQNSTFIGIPDQGAATPSPTSVTITGEPGTVTDINVSLVTLTHTAPRDLLVTLVGPQGQQVNVMRLAGGTTDVNKILVTFDDEASETLSLNEAMTTGAYKPADIISGSSLSVFDGTDPNGTWSLFVTDTSALDSGQIELGWAMTIQRAPRTAPYPSTIDVSGLPSGVTDVDVTLHGLSHSRASDLDVLLVGPNGQQATLVSDVGGSSVIGAADVTLDDEAANALPSTNNISAGRYRPTNPGGGADPFLTPAPSATGAESLSAFDGTDPNGAWRLFVVDDDDAGDFTGSLSGWSLTITTPDPPPAPPAADTAAPTGSLVINDGAARTRSNNLTLTTAADGTGSVVAHMRFSNDRSTWSPFEAFASTKAWPLPTATNGSRTVWAQYRDAAGNLSVPVADAIFLDTVRPKVTRTAPTAGTTAVAVGRTVSARLSEAASSRTISKATAYLTRLGSTSKVKAVVRYDAAKRLVTINPRSDLARGTTYRVTVASGIKDLAGNSLDQSTKKGLQPKRWTFTTS